MAHKGVVLGPVSRGILLEQQHCAEAFTVYHQEWCHGSERLACETIWWEAACQSPRWLVKRERLDAESRSAYEKSHGIKNGKTRSWSSWETSQNALHSALMTWRITEESLTSQCGTVSVMHTAFAFTSFSKKSWHWEVGNIIPLTFCLHSFKFHKSSVQGALAENGGCDSVWAMVSIVWNVSWGSEMVCSWS